MSYATKKDIFRIIDANLNRSREGLRVCEDISRFILNSASITKDLKSVRHSVSDIAMKSINGRAEFLKSRNSEEDIGRCSCEPKEMKRRDYTDIVVGGSSASIYKSVRGFKRLDYLFEPDFIPILYSFNFLRSKNPNVRYDPRSRKLPS